ncbi:unnamed protein product [Musa hybrid cultivar]
MSSAACISLGPTPLSHLKNAEKGAAFSLASVRGAGFRPSPNALFLRIPSRPSRRKPSPRRTAVRPFSPVMEWQDCSSEIEVDVPCSVAYDCYSDREMIPKWMPFISSVKVLANVFLPNLFKQALTIGLCCSICPFLWRTNLKIQGLNFIISWLNIVMQSFFPIKGAVRFFPKGPSSCRIQLTVSYEIPEILIPVASALKPFLEGLLAQGLERFAKVAKEYQRKIPQR